MPFVNSRTENVRLPRRSHLRGSSRKATISFRYLERSDGVISRKTSALATCDWTMPISVTSPNCFRRAPLRGCVIPRQRCTQSTAKRLLQRAENAEKFQRHRPSLPRGAVFVVGSRVAEERVPGLREDDLLVRLSGGG